jgi:hypothetical protein
MLNYHRRIIRIKNKPALRRENEIICFKGLRMKFQSFWNDPYPTKVKLHWFVWIVKQEECVEGEKKISFIKKVKTNSFVESTRNKWWMNRLTTLTIRCSSVQCRCSDPFKYIYLFEFFLIGRLFSSCSSPQKTIPLSLQSTKRLMRWPKYRTRYPLWRVLEPNVLGNQRFSTCFTAERLPDLDWDTPWMRK